MITLSAKDREFVAYRMWPHVYSNEQKGYVAFVPAEGREAELKALEIVHDDHEMGMDSHGVMVHLTVLRETPDGPLLAFRWGTTSEESLFDAWEEELFEVTEESERVTRYSFKRANGDRIEF